MTIWWLSWHRSIVGSNSMQYRPRCEKLMLLDRQTNIWFFKRSPSKKRKNLKSEAYSLDSILTIATSQTTSAKSSRLFITEFYVCTSKKVSDQNYFEIKEGLGTSREAQNKIPQIDVEILLWCTYRFRSILREAYPVKCLHSNDEITLCAAMALNTVHIHTQLKMVYWNLRAEGHAINHGWSFCVAWPPVEHEKVKPGFVF